MNKISPLYKISVLLFLLFIACSTQKHNLSTYDITDFIYGKIDKDQLYADLPSWLEVETNYEPDLSIVSKINEIDHHVDVFIFLGSWCSDSRRNVPAFLKSIKGNSKIKTQIWALDRKKQIDNGLHEKYNIKRVPTFIFNYNESEIGRIVEYPKQNMERDIWEILNNIKGIKPGNYEETK